MAFHGAGTQGLPPGSLGSGFAWGNPMRGNSAEESKRVCPDDGAEPWLGREKTADPLTSTSPRIHFTFRRGTGSRYTFIILVLLETYTEIRVLVSAFQKSNPRQKRLKPRCWVIDRVQRGRGPNYYYSS